jgi:putative pyruvate formate lyase activating enzyme
MLQLQEQGCHNIEAVTPTPQLPQLIAALRIAREQGLTLPFVYNCGGYENPDMIHLLKGWVDIYLPDFKYGNEENACAFSGVRNYAAYALASLQEMTEQVGFDLLLDTNEVATRGIIIRHLVLPGCTENSMTALSLLRNHFPPDIPISLMSQYTPTASVRNHPLLKRRITSAEYELVVNHALDMGFEQLFIQEVDDRDICPDFDEDAPFQWLDHDEP